MANSHDIIYLPAAYTGRPIDVNYERLFIKAEVFTPFRDSDTKHLAIAKSPSFSGKRICNIKY